eukprot:56846-Heterocapsa_arctica.AAC.1
MLSRANAPQPSPAGQVVPRGQAMGSADVPYGTAEDYAGEEDMGSLKIPPAWPPAGLASYPFPSWCRDIG